MKTIKVLGTGCPNCVRLENNIKIALKKTGIKAKIEKVTDIAKIMGYGIMGTPGFVINETVLSSGKVLEVDEIISFLHGEKDTQKTGESLNQKEPSSQKGTDDKIESATRILFITSILTGLYTYLYDGNIVSWLQNWGMIYAIVLSIMCFIVRPYLIAPISKKIGKKGGKMVGMILLVVIMSILFTYRFNGFYENVVMNLLKNFGILFITTLPSVFIIINPILKLIFQK